MYQRILVPVEHSDNDEVISQHVRKLARTCNDASIVLIHVSEGWVARNIHELDLRESEEMKSDHEYIEAMADDLEKDGYRAEAILAGGDPAREIAAGADGARPSAFASIQRAADRVSAGKLGTVGDR
jgi:nucleotide-binding universal stress UspA family protein